jgi:hypothetical protein
MRGTVRQPDRRSSTPADISSVPEAGGEQIAIRRSACPARDAGADMCCRIAPASRPCQNFRRQTCRPYDPGACPSSRAPALLTSGTLTYANASRSNAICAGKAAFGLSRVRS